jgi:hypothetical protein
LFGEGPATALWLLAPKPAYSQIDQNAVTRDREISEMTLVLAVERC